MCWKLLKPEMSRVISQRSNLVVTAKLVMSDDLMSVQLCLVSLEPRCLQWHLSNQRSKPSKAQ